MKRIEALLRDTTYREYLRRNEEAEHDRVYCHHDWQHCWEVARTALILYLQDPEEVPALHAYTKATAQEIIYAAAFLHDIGRHLEYADPSRDHAKESADLARPLLMKAGFAVDERALVLTAITNHRRGGDDFCGLLYRADKESRPCLTCTVSTACKRFTGRSPSITI